MKTFLLIATFFFVTGSTFAQTKVCYTYDNAGNRLSSGNICVKSTPAAPDSTLKSQPIAETLGEMKISLYPSWRGFAIRAFLARNYASMDYVLDVCLITQDLKTY